MAKLEADNLNIVNPFLRWTGSKRWFISEHIHKFLPNSFKNYHEPFLGGGAVFFYLKSTNRQKSRKFFLSDSNEDLINCYKQLKEHPNSVIQYLKNYKNSEEAYYQIRCSKPQRAEKKAAKFIYLNRTSFNGIYRVNSSGTYNVPYGHRQNVDLVTPDLLQEVSNILQDVEIENYSFEESLQNIRKNDLVFIDPPYTVAHENNGFIEYNQNLFSWNDQLKLRDFIIQVMARGAYFILTNASHNSIVNLYTGIGMSTKLSRTCKVGGRIKTRGTYNELIINNFTT